ncbi:MAG: mitochondrial carrier-like protein [Sylvanvirus sp.]|uniref:Mitochondrial carrier-like protein n=1 Tax=Sylvanvirus sp. TaxID=2487774 RepID=A0A3G5ALD7_9VIRU|nr:MAG: mitochondrial carrier-like protein [Sylvanvirus sp.]
MTTSNISNPSNSSRTYQHLLYTAIGTTLAELATAPICTLKTKYQNLPLHSTQSICHTINSLYSEHGLKAFFRSSGIATFEQVFSTSAKYTAFRYMTDHPDTSFLHVFPHHRFMSHVLNAITTGIVISFITHPLNFIRVETQMQITLPQLIRQVRDKGIFILYRGWTKNLFKIVVGSSLFFPLHEYFTTELKWSRERSSLMTGVIGTVCTHPFDYAKVRSIHKLPWRQGYSPFPYFKGLSLNLCRTVPHFFIIMNVFHWLDKK